MKKVPILLTGSIYEKALKKLKLRSDIQFSQKDANEAELMNMVKQQNTQIFIVRGGKISADIINSAPGLKAIIKHGVGFNNININEAKKRNIPVFYTPNANYESVAEHALALIMILIKQIHRYNQEMKSNRKWCKGKYQPVELQEKTLGLIGLGRIGRRLIELVLPFHLRTLAYDPFLSLSEVPDSVEMVQSLDQLLKISDIVSIHCPLNGQTENLISSNELSQMKKTAFLVNTARGAIIDQQALIRALQEGIITGAGLDTFAQEPLPEDSPLYKMENVIMTPHIGGTAKESYMRMGEEVVEMAIKIIEGRIEEIIPENRVI